MKTVLLSGVAILGMVLAVPAFACDGHDEGKTAQTEKASCGACGTEKCACDKDKEGKSCGSCGTEACTCGDKEGAKKASKKAS